MDKENVRLRKCDFYATCIKRLLLSETRFNKRIIPEGKKGLRDGFTGDPK